MLVQSPLTLFVLFAGYFYLEKQGRFPKEDSAQKISAGFRPFLKELLPVLMVIFIGIGTGGLLSFLVPKYKLGIESGLIFALTLAIVNVWFSQQMTGSEIRKILVNPQMLKMIYMIFAILVFKGMLEDSNAVEAVTGELTFLHIPLVLIVAILPLLVGLITGITIAFVGSAFPILIPLVGSLDPGGNLLFYLMLAMACGFAGVLMSPVHLCLILSNEYFGVSMGSVYRYLWKPCLYLVVMGFVYFYLLKLYSGTGI
jgi:integral membrane protein (TIGR00529 family)